jgi:hypothetical protein
VGHYDLWVIITHKTSPQYSFGWGIMQGLQVPTADGAPPFCPIAGLNLQNCKIVGHNFHLSHHAFKTIFIAGIHL